MTMPGEGFTTVGAEELLWLTAEEMRAVDDAVVDDLGVDLVRMMENAGRSLAELAVRLFHPVGVEVLAGGGGNGGGGLVAARHLANRGVAVSVALDRPAGGLAGVPAAQLGILRRMGVPIDEPPSAGHRPVDSADLLIDALVGYGLTGPLAGWTAGLAGMAAPARGAGTRVLSLDVPSGLDASTGRVGDLCVVADATLTLAMPKVGLRSAGPTGELYLADISVPPALYATLGLGAVGPVFADSQILRISPRG